MNIKKSILLLLFVVLSFFLRFWHIAQMPPGLYLDEASIAYNAYSIWQTGKDEFGQSWPYWFEAFGEYKLPVYIYAVSISMVVFGPTDFAVRFPSALAGSLGTLAIYWLVWLSFYKDKRREWLAIGAAGFWSFSSWSLQFSRGGFEANLAMTLIIVGFAGLYAALRLRRTWWLYPAGLTFVVAIATYNSARLFVPLLLLVWAWLYRQRLFKWKGIILRSVILVGLLGSPLLIGQFSEVGLVRARETSILGEQGMVSTAQRFLTNYIDHFDTTYLFFHGDQYGRHSIRKQGMLYYFQLPLILIGLVQALKNRNRTNTFWIAWLLLSPLPAALTSPTPHALRSLNSLPAWLVFTTLGSVALFLWVNTRLKARILRYGFRGLFVLLIAYNFAIYLADYSYRYRLATGLDWNDGLRETVQLIKANYENYDQIYLTNQLPFVYLAFYLPIDPQLSHQLLSHNQNQLISFDKFHYFDYAWEIESQQSRLIVAPWWQTAPEDSLVAEIKIENGDPLFNVWEQDASN